jgi:antirestriction protein ArdC
MKKSFKKLSTDQVIDQFAKPIIDVLNEGKLVWNMPFMKVNGGASAYNFNSKTAYKGFFNQLSLGALSMSKGYDHNAWLTYNGAKKLGGNVKKGEQGAYVVFWKFIKKEIKGSDGSIEEKSIPFLRYFKVFNVAQCEGIEMPKVKKTKKFGVLKVLKEAEAIVNAYDLREENLKIKRDGKNGAFYRPSTDEIECPSMRNHVESAKGRGESVNDGKQHYYSTMFHEMIHSTGSDDRLKRLEKGFSFGDHSYSKEELVAEIGSAILSEQAQLKSSKVHENTLAYCQGWAKKLKSEPKWIIWASSRAYKGANYILTGEK